jgi:tRNA U38,U39,U40 pseudouridine synthase TruA
MVRNIVGAILAVNEGKISLDDFIDYIENPKIGKVKYKAPAEGLYKVTTTYPKKSLKI